MRHECWTTAELILFEDDSIQIIKTMDTSYPAILYKQFFPAVSVGSRLLINQTATSLKLGTGGYDYVKQVCASKRESPKSNAHIMKLRYTPLQHAQESVEDAAGPYHALFQPSFSLEQKKVILAELHSMVPVIYDVAKAIKPSVTCCFIFDDSASLTLEISSHFRKLRQEKNVQSISIGQCMGGEYNAVTLASALQFAYSYLKPDLIIISVGPGVVGTGTKYGHTAMDMAHWANTVGSLHGCPVWIPRLSFADKRSRHYGLSHHTITPLKEFTYCSCVLIFPPLKNAQKKLLTLQLEGGSRVIHQFIYSVALSNEEAVDRALSVGKVNTMGREYAEDPSFFEAVSEAVSFCLEGYTSSIHSDT